jgi:uncharacterized membrane protein YidH (DUF202 family)
MMKTIQPKRIFFDEWFSKGYHGLHWDYADKIKFNSARDVVAYVICGIGIYLTIAAIACVWRPSEDAMRENVNAQEQNQEMVSSQV